MNKSQRSSTTAGVIMITVGVLFLLNEFFDINFRKWWPVTIIVVGVMILYNARKGEEVEYPNDSNKPTKELDSYTKDYKSSSHEE